MKKRGARYQQATAAPFISKLYAYLGVRASLEDFWHARCLERPRIQKKWSDNETTQESARNKVAGSASKP